MEEWRSVPGYEGFYEVSDLGRVRSVDRQAVNAIGRRRVYVGRVLKVWHDKDGYPTVVLVRAGKARRTQKVHLLVMAAFVGLRPDGHEICHENDVKSDNRLSNLRYASSADNKDDGLRNGVYPLTWRAPRFV